MVYINSPISLYHMEWTYVIAMEIINRYKVKKISFGDEYYIPKELSNHIMFRCYFGEKTFKSKISALMCRLLGGMSKKRIKKITDSYQESASNLFSY